MGCLTQKLPHSVVVDALHTQQSLPTEQLTTSAINLEGSNLCESPGHKPGCRKNCGERLLQLLPSPPGLVVSANHYFVKSHHSRTINTSLRHVPSSLEGIVYCAAVHAANTIQQRTGCIVLGCVLRCCVL
jgi:hypothetical protein